MRHLLSTEDVFLPAVTVTATVTATATAQAHGRPPAGGSLVFDAAID